MLNKKLVTVLFFGFIIWNSAAVNPQEKPSVKKDKQAMMQHDDMQKCMDMIAADSSMRMQMMNKMMDQTKDNNGEMMKMCKMMIGNPDMHSMMMKMMHGDGEMMGEKMMKNKMMPDSTKKIKKSEHELHHKNN